MNDFTSEACKDFARMLESEEGYDVKIYVDEEPNMEEIHAHSFVLRARCPYFKTAFSSNWAKKEDGYYIFYKPNVTASVFRIVLRHWYSGDVDWTNYTEDDIFQLLIITDEFGLRLLNEHVENHLIKNHLKYLEENPIKILQFVDSHNSFTSLKKLCLKKLCSSAKEFFNLDVFLTIEESILLMILKCEDLNNIKEIEIWDSVLKWGLARFPEIENDVKKWTPQDFINMRDTLKNVIPLIRFREISGKDYFDKIKPYKKIREKDFRDNILRYYIVNDEKSLSNLPFRCPIINSTLIDQKHVLLFSSWIDKAGKLYDSIEQVKYKFMLLYQSNKEGLEVSRYHQRCDAVSKTLTVVGIQNSDQIIGGYNPLDWSGYGYKSTLGSFIFNLNNKNDINTAKFSYVKDSSFAVYCDTLYLPTFGAGHDIFLSENSSSGSSSYSYNNIYIPKSFNIGTIEVFQVIEKK